MRSYADDDELLSGRWPPPPDPDQLHRRVTERRVQAMRLLAQAATDAGVLEPSPDCPEGYLRHPVYGCVDPAFQQACQSSDGQMGLINADGQCVSVDGCPPGFTFDPNSVTCQPGLEEVPDCLDGQVFSPAYGCHRPDYLRPCTLESGAAGVVGLDGQCVLASNATCPPGTPAYACPSTSHLNPHEVVPTWLLEQIQAGLTAEQITGSLTDERNRILLSICDFVWDWSLLMAVSVIGNSMFAICGLVAAAEHLTPSIRKKPPTPGAAPPGQPPTKPVPRTGERCNFQGQGDGLVRSDGECISLRPGDSCFLPGDSPHELVEGVVDTQLYCRRQDSRGQAKGSPLPSLSCKPGEVFVWATEECKPAGPLPDPGHGAPPTPPVQEPTSSGPSDGTVLAAATAGVAALVGVFWWMSRPVEPPAPVRQPNPLPSTRRTPSRR